MLDQTIYYTQHKLICLRKGAKARQYHKRKWAPAQIEDRIHQQIT